MQGRKGGKDASHRRPEEEKGEASGDPTRSSKRQAGGFSAERRDRGEKRRRNVKKDHLESKKSVVEYTTKKRRKRERCQRDLAFKGGRRAKGFQEKNRKKKEQVHVSQGGAPPHWERKKPRAGIRIRIARTVGPREESVAWGDFRSGRKKCDRFSEKGKGKGAKRGTSPLKEGNRQEVSGRYGESVR